MLAWLLMMLNDGANQTWIQSKSNDDGAEVSATMFACIHAGAKSFKETCRIIRSGLCDTLDGGRKGSGVDWHQEHAICNMLCQSCIMSIWFDLI
jgi:hypothetical protein